jgi:hypothetical protein
MTKPAILEQLKAEAPYELRSVSRTATPSNSDGDWYQYVITQGKSEVTGLRSGTVAEVDFFLRDMIERLNERRMGKTRPKGKPSAPITSNTAREEQSK